MSTERGDYVLSDDRARLDVDAIWQFLSTEAYWGRWRDRCDVERQLASAWRVMAAYDSDGRLAAFARAISDGVTSAYLGDVFVLREHRGAGLGVALVEQLVTRGPGAPLRWMLHTADAHGLYRRFGFAPPDSGYLERPRPPADPGEWELSVAQVWATASPDGQAEVVAIQALAAERAGSAEAAFELASAYDLAGREADAEPLYRQALALGLDDGRAPRAVLQLASTVRTLGRPLEALDLLAAELPDRFAEARAAFAALALLDLGRDRDAAVLALQALSGRLPEYGRAVANYAGEAASSDS